MLECVAEEWREGMVAAVLEKCGDQTGEFLPVRV